MLERLTGISAQRALPQWRRDVFAPHTETVGPADGREVVFAPVVFGANEPGEGSTSGKHEFPSD